MGLHLLIQLYPIDTFDDFDIPLLSDLFDVLFYSICIAV
jgi:hypothetical protein